MAGAEEILLFVTQKGLDQGQTLKGSVVPERPRLLPMIVLREMLEQKLMPAPRW